MPKESCRQPRPEIDANLAKPEHVTRLRLRSARRGANLGCAGGVRQRPLSMLRADSPAVEPDSRVFLIARRYTLTTRYRVDRKAGTGAGAGFNGTDCADH